MSKAKTCGSCWWGVVNKVRDDIIDCNFALPKCAMLPKISIYKGAMFEKAYCPCWKPKGKGE